MPSSPRYAVYFVPPADSPLYRFGASVLGYDSYRGETVRFPDGLDTPQWRALTEAPRRYGFHATLKAPFPLADGIREAHVLDALDALAGAAPAFDAGRLAVSALGSFVALVPDRPSSRLNALADACVRRFERFRAPLQPAERERRLAAPLTPRQIEHVDRWGYPFVFGDFRFHMTLTGALPPHDREAVLTGLRAQFEQAVSSHDLRVSQIVVARQSTPGAAFRVIAAAALGGIVTGA